MVVDDEEMMRDLMQQALAQDAQEVLTAANGKEAMFILVREHIDLIISDVVMPEMDGIEMLLKAKHICPRVPVILVSGFPSDETATRVKGLGARGYIAKPFDLDVLRRTVADVL